MKTNLFDLNWWKATGTRMAQTAAMAVLAVNGADRVDLVTLDDWKALGVVAGNAAALSLVKSLAVGVPEVPTSKTLRARMAGLRKPLPDDNLDHDPAALPDELEVPGPYSEEV